MTIRFIQQWNGHSPDEVNSSLGSTEEARIVGLNLASYDLDGANDGVEEFVKAKRNLLTGGGVFSAGGKAYAAFFAVPYRAEGWASDVNQAILAAHAAGGGAVFVPGSSVPYVVDSEILFDAVSNVSLILSPGVIITRPDPFVLTGTLVSGSMVVNLTAGDTAKIKAGYYAAHYVVGTGVPLAARISRINSLTQFQIDKPASASGTVTLTFHYAHNIIRRQNSTNIRIVCPFGRATLDGNGEASPVTFDSADALRNCIRTAACTDVETSGVKLKNAHYHGEIGVGTGGKIRLLNIHTERNGFRGIHYHGTSGTDSVADVFADEIDLYRDGYKAWMVNNDQLNTGLFIVFDNMSNVQVGRVRARRICGIGVAVTGTSLGGTRSSRISYQSIVCEDVAIPLAILNGVRNITFNLQAKGSLYQFAASVLGTGTSQLPLWKTDGSAYVVGALMQPIVLPVGTNMDPFDIGQAVYLQDITSGLDVRLSVWAVDTASRTIWVFNYATPTTRPWVVGNDGASALVSIWTSRGPGVYIDGNTTNNYDHKTIHAGSIQLDTIGSKAIAVANIGAGLSYIEDFHIGSYSQKDCYAGAYLYNVTDLWIGSVNVLNTGNRRTGNDGGNTGFYLQHCKDVEISKFRGVSSTIGGMTRNGIAELQIDTGCNNVKIMHSVVGSSNNGAGTIQATGTNIVLGDPRLVDGTTFTPYTTGSTNCSVFRYGLT